MRVKSVGQTSRRPFIFTWRHSYSLSAVLACSSRPAEWRKPDPPAGQPGHRGRSAPNPAASDSLGGCRLDKLDVGTKPLADLSGHSAMTVSNQVQITVRQARVWVTAPAVCCLRRLRCRSQRSPLLGLSRILHVCDGSGRLGDGRAGGLDVRSAASRRRARVAINDEGLELDLQRWGLWMRKVCQAKFRAGRTFKACRSTRPRISVLPGGRSKTTLCTPQGESCCRRALVRPESRNRQGDTATEFNNRFTCPPTAQPVDLSRLRPARSPGRQAHA